jgi:hypothetical protein
MCLLECFWYSLKDGLKGKRWPWTKKRLPLYSSINVSCSKSLYLFLISLGFTSFLWGNGVKRLNSSSVLVLDAKGGEIKAKATGSATTCEFFKSFSVRILYCKNCSLQPAVHRTVSGAQASAPANWSISGKHWGHHSYNSQDCPVCTGLSGVPAARLANGRPRDKRVTRGSANGQKWEHLEGGGE